MRRRSQQNYAGRSQAPERANDIVGPEMMRDVEPVFGCARLQMRKTGGVFNDDDTDTFAVLSSECDEGKQWARRWRRLGRSIIGMSV